MVGGRGCGLWLGRWRRLFQRQHNRNESFDNLAVGRSPEERRGIDLEMMMAIEECFNRASPSGSWAVSANWYSGLVVRSADDDEGGRRLERWRLIPALANEDFEVD